MSVQKASTFLGQGFEHYVKRPSAMRRTPFGLREETQVYFPEPHVQLPGLSAGAASPRTP